MQFVRLNPRVRILAFDRAVGAEPEPAGYPRHKAVHRMTPARLQFRDEIQSGFFLLAYLPACFGRGTVLPNCRAGFQRRRMRDSGNREVSATSVANAPVT